MITRSLIPWTQLIRQGVPDQFRVMRHALTLNGREVLPGEIVVPSDFLNRSRLRQMYEQRKIEPVVAPVGSVQAARPVKDNSKPNLSAFALGLPFDPGVIQVSDEPASLPSHSVPSYQSKRQSKRST